MAEADWGGVHAQAAYPQPEQSTSIVNWTGAILSLMLIVGMAIWGYRLAMRDVSGVPVVRALEGPMRIQPEDPGGQAAAHQGFAVNTVQAEGQAEATAERLALAPRPIELTDEDRPVTTVTRIEAAVQVVPQPPGAGAVAAALALADSLSAGVEPFADEVPVKVAAATPATPSPIPRPEIATPIAAPAPTAPTAPAVIPASVPGLSASPRPMPRPELPAGYSPATAPGAETPEPAVSEAASASIPVGTRLVQLGAFDSADVARAQWDKLAIKFEDYMEGKTRVIEEASSGGKNFYRLRAMGFADLADARRFCSVMMASKAACIPVVTR